MHLFLFQFIGDLILDRSPSIVTAKIRLTTSAASGVNPTIGLLASFQIAVNDRACEVLAGLAFDWKVERILRLVSLAQYLFIMLRERGKIIVPLALSTPSLMAIRRTPR